jgi:hypothetical protein
MIKRTPIVIAAVVAAAAAVTAGIVLVPGLTSRPAESVGSAPVAKPAATTAAPTAAAAPAGTACAKPTTTVSSASQLSKALASAKPGSVIALRDGTYRGRFSGAGDATAAKPIVVCGGAGAVIDAGGTSDGYGFHLDGADHWTLSGFTVRNAQKGVMVDDSQSVTVTGLTVTAIGDEGIHVRDASTGARVIGNAISDTGRRTAKYGEGIYIGTAESNWCDISSCKPDRSDGALVQGNRITATTAEAVDIKEGTSGGTLEGNTFDGAGATEADSWVDVKGNDWTIRGNTGTSAPEDGFQTHEVVDGWGTGNTFTGNSAAVDGDGYGFHLAPELDNTVSCTNTVSQAGKGLANVACAKS